MFNRDPPPNFRGLDPYKPIRVYYRHLPHWRQDGATYFVTFRLADALPHEKLAFLKRLRGHWDRTHPAPRSERDWEQHARHVTRLVEAWSDEGHGACHFRDPLLAKVVTESFAHFQSIRYFISCWVIMPNHCHLVIRPLDHWSLETILQGFKGVTARKVNRMIGCNGSLWQDESFDRIIRDEEHLWHVVQYIGRNPIHAGFSNEWSRWIAAEWVAAGWRFETDLVLS